MSNREDAAYLMHADKNADADARQAADLIRFMDGRHADFVIVLSALHCKVACEAWCDFGMVLYYLNAAYEALKDVRPYTDQDLTDLAYEMDEKPRIE